MSQKYWYYPVAMWEIEHNLRLVLDYQYCKLISITIENLKKENSNYLRTVVEQCSLYYVKPDLFFTY